jgi:shikimate kinase
MNGRRFVLGLAGPPGAGKTTLALLVQQRHPGARLISFDRYQPLTGLSQQEIRDWFERGADPNEFEHREIVADLRRETGAGPGLILFETPFGRLHRATGGLIDCLVWLETPLDIALARAVLASSRNAQREAAPEAARGFIEWQIQYMNFYPVARAMYLAQIEKVAPAADLRLDTTRPAEALAEAIARWLSSRGVA